jgi:UDP-N-acetylglucosamine:LPS N-acetylglucosamine transferase
MICVKKVMFISSTGGHLEELMQLKKMFDRYDYYIVTENTKSNMKLKEKYKGRISYLVYGSYTNTLSKLVYPFKLLFNSIKSFFLYLKVRPMYIISTGAHTSGPMCLIGHLFGSKIIFIETFANSSSKSKTGSLVYKFADLFIVQWESMLELYPNAVYGGWIF